MGGRVYFQTTGYVLPVYCGTMACMSVSRLQLTAGPSMTTSSCDTNHRLSRVNFIVEGNVYDDVTYPDQRCERADHGGKTMPRLFMLMYVSVMGIGTGAALVAGYPLFWSVVAGWLFPSIVLSVMMLPPIAIRRMQQHFLRVQAATS